MRIALFSETFLPKVDGIVTTLSQTIKHLKMRGHEVLIFAPDSGAEEYEQSRIVPMRGRPMPLYPELTLSLPRASMRQALDEFRPDIVHAADPVLLGVAALYYSGGRNGGPLGVPLVISYHTDLPKYLHYYRLGFLERVVWPLLRVRHRRAQLNLCTSFAMMEQLRDHGIEQFDLWPGGVDSDLFHPSRRSEEMRHRLSEGQPERPLLLYVGRLSAEKDIERLKPILMGLPNARLALVGDGPHRNALRRHFAGLPVVMAGFMHGEELASAYASSDVMVMPSRTETLGLVVLEAMASGLPVMGANAGGIPELIEPGVSGHLFERESEAVSAIAELLQSPEKAAAMREGARKRAVGASWAAATDQLLQHYELALARFAARDVEEVRPRRTSPVPPPSQVLGMATTSVIRKLLP